MTIREAELGVLKAARRWAYFEDGGDYEDIVKLGKLNESLVAAVDRLDRIIEKESKTNRTIGTKKVQRKTKALVK